MVSELGGSSNVRAEAVVVVEWSNMSWIGRW